MSTRTFSASVALAMVLAGGGVACGDDEQGAAPTTSPAATTTETVPATTAPTETTPKPEPPPKPKVRTVRIVVEQGRPRGGIKRPALKQGERVRIVIRSDAGMEVHLHGYDITRPVRPGQPTQLAFRATIPGRFELELHHPDAVLADLEVRP